jgi:hypothetical protein
MAALPGELRMTLKNQRAGIDDYVFAALVAVLAKQTGQRHGKDLVAWLNWWQGAAKDYGCPAPGFDAEEARRLQAEYRELF